MRSIRSSAEHYRHRSLCRRHHPAADCPVSSAGALPSFDFFRGGTAETSPGALPSTCCESSCASIAQAYNVAIGWEAVVSVAKVGTNPRPRKPAPVAKWRVDVIAIGASAGGFPAIVQVLAALTADAPAVLIVQHLDPKRKSFLAGLLAQKTSRAVKQAEHDEPIQAGTIYVCPPDHHMLVAGHNIELSHSELVHFSRPSIDLLFESVAGRYRTRCMGVILSGSNSDGATGIRAIRLAGGITLAQQPASAEFRIMPQAAIDTGCIDFVAPLDKLGGEIMRLCAKNQQP